ncbi:winged helix-turn-helix transcriptional regulator [Rhodococcus tibetensis]|uniref:Helix-turn-helix transcriptional regulator n=1 Tax=Rhodococcus tibetensis TaxID=2965064 RepID=A0ABT1Q8W4_9NOCA|nr:helix-turn-helix domain-containing protein [Rhodococcus sp. FXJ9.536]MCQ4118704.1 helix-turn-helix transcriptional regulator [Rhodococcus sp. FXJ9.536]
MSNGRAEPTTPKIVMDRMPLAPRPCAIAATMELIGDRWSMLVIRELSYGVHRFDRIAGYVGVSRDILTARLRKLEEVGVIERRQYSERPPRFEYHLTAAGEELRPLLRSLFQWGSRWAVNEPASELVHDCGHTLELEHRCRHCGREVDDATVAMHARPQSRNS